MSDIADGYAFPKSNQCKKMKTTDASESPRRPDLVPEPANVTIVHQGWAFQVIRIELKNGLVFIANSNGGIVKES